MSEQHKYDQLPEFLVNTLNNQASEEDRYLLNAWLETAAANREFYEDLQKIWNYSAEAVLADKIDVDQEWQKFRDKLGKSGTGRTVRIHTRRTWLAVAASLALLIATGLAFYLPDFGIASRSYSSQTAVLDLQLEDGTEVSLNKGTELTVSRSFGKRSRKVKLDGEAFFRVSSGPDKNFEIQVNHSLVVVHGTSFNVRAFREEPSIQVMVTEGIVGFKKRQGSESEHFLHKGQKLTYRKEEKELHTSAKYDPNELAWQTGLLSFENNDLGYVVSLLSDYYGIPVKLANEDIAKCTISTNFRNENLETVLKVISSTLNLKVNREGEAYVLSGPGC